MLDFPGIAKGACTRPEIYGKGLPNKFGTCGLGWNMVFMDNGYTTEQTTDVGVGEAGCMKGRKQRTEFVSAMKAGRYYCSTGVTITNITVQGVTITVETSDADTVFASIDHGEVIAKVKGTTLTFDVPSYATYARVTATRGEGVNLFTGKQYAWTQPFWVYAGGIAKSFDPRRRPHMKENLNLLLTLTLPLIGDIHPRKSRRGARLRTRNALQCME